MHIEPGVVNAAKITLSLGTATLLAGATLHAARHALRTRGATALLLSTLLSTLLVFCCFEVLPHQPVGVSEVHLILGTTAYLLFGLAPAALGLAGGLLLQGLFFAPTDLPQYGMNLTTLLAPLFVMHWAARRILPAGRAYVELDYAAVLKLSAAYQGGIVAWVAFWAIYGQGLGADNLSQVASFGAAYMSVLLIEPLIDLAVLAAARAFHARTPSLLLAPQLYPSSH